MATDMVKPPGVTMCRKGAWAATHSKSLRRADSSDRAKHRSTVAPGPSGSCVGSVSVRSSNKSIAYKPMLTIPCLQSRSIRGCQMSLAVKKRTLALHSPSISGKSSIVADHAMAGNCYRQRVCTASLSHGPNGVRHTDPICNIGVARRRAGRDVIQGLPDALLKSGAPNIQRQGKIRGRGLHKGHHRGDQLFELAVTADQVGMREAILQVTGKRIRIVTDQNGTDSTFTLRHQDGAQRAFPYCETYLGRNTAFLIAGGCHAQFLI